MRMKTCEEKNGLGSPLIYRAASKNCYLWWMAAPDGSNLHGKTERQEQLTDAMLCGERL